MYSLKKYFLKTLFLFLFTVTSFSVTREYYRSNANGLMLLKITPEEVKEFKYVVLVDTSGDLVFSKLLYKDNTEIKKWTYTYQGNMLESEMYYKERVLTEESKYDRNAHKTLFIEYHNGKILKTTKYQYNSDGVVDREEIYNYMTKETNILRYKYDRNFRIKQIEKKTGNKTVYWESFYTGKGIILKEYYSLKDEMFTFYYNENGQELRGEVKKILPDKTETVKVSWENFYTDDGLRDRKDEENFELDTRTITWYNKNSKERRIESYSENELVSVEEFEYNEDNKILYYKKVYDLNLQEIRYKYDTNGELAETKTYEDRVLKKETKFFPNGTRTETIYSRNMMKFTTTYDREGNVVK